MTAEAERLRMPGIYTMPAATYHADPCEVPSLSSGIARLLIRRSPMHAHHAHARFGGNSRDPSATMDAGSILHKLMLGEGDDYEAVQAENWTTKAAKEAREAIREAGRIPVLAHQLEALQAGAEAALAQMREHPDCGAFFDAGQSEAVLVAEDRGAWLRCMVDRLPTGERMPWFDIKTTKASAAPVDFQRAMIRDHAFQEAFYRRIGRLLNRKPRAFFFVVVEQDAPHAIAVMAAAPSLVEIADLEVERAVSVWRRCMEAQRWPGYPARTAYVEAPAWATQAEEAANMDEEVEA